MTTFAAPPVRTQFARLSAHFHQDGESLVLEPSPLSDSNRRPLPYHEGAGPREHAETQQPHRAACVGVGPDVGLRVRSPFARQSAHAHPLTGAPDPRELIRLRIAAALEVGR